MSEIKTKIEAETKSVCELYDLAVSEMKQLFTSGNCDIALADKVADMVKDFAEAKKSIVEACYKTAIAEAMEESEYGEDYDENGRMRRYYRGQPRGSDGRYRRRYTEAYYPDAMMDYYGSYDFRDMDRDNGRMYYSGSGNSTKSGGSQSYQSRDVREGRAGMSRKNYMESKQIHSGNSSEDKQAKMRELEEYMRSLSDDITEMISDASNEERSVLKNKLQSLIQKV